MHHWLCLAGACTFEGAAGMNVSGLTASWLVQWNVRGRRSVAHTSGVVRWLTTLPSGLVLDKRGLPQVQQQQGGAGWLRC